MSNQYSTLILVITPIIYNIRAVQGICESINALGLSPIVHLNTGFVQGLSCVSALGQSYFSYRGIPYAAPPLGGLRFKAPRPPLKWKGVLNATIESPVCPQPQCLTKFPIHYSEDCLFLNVFTTYKKRYSGKRLPVIVFIHGGYFYSGSGSVYEYGPDFFLQKNVILVTFNYRLGVLGYLNMNIPGVQGNAALKDKVQVLRWVKREIIKFGGDPNLVTIFGSSSGGGTVNLLYTSPMAKGLFSRAVSHSGPVKCLPSNYKFGLQLARAFNCQVTTPQEVVGCLRGVGAQELAEQQTMFWGVDGLECPFVPTLETYHGEEVFLSADPKTLMAHGPPIPYLMGVNSGEGLMYIKDPQEVPDEFENTTNLVVKYFPTKIFEQGNPAAVQEAIARTEEFYFGTNSSLIDKIYGFVNYTSDILFIYRVANEAKRISVRAPVYLYYFCFEGEFQTKDHDYQKLNLSLSGVSHLEELGYFFYRNYTLEAHNNLTAYPRDMEMVDTVTTMWANFARFRNPTPFQQNWLNSTWLPVMGEFTQHLQIDDVTTMVRSPLLEKRMAFLDDLYSFVFQKHKIGIATTKFFSTGFCLFLVCVVIFAVAFVKNYIRHRDYKNWK